MSIWDIKEAATENVNDPFQKQFHKLALYEYMGSWVLSLFLLFLVQPFPSLLPPTCVIAEERRVGEVEDSIGRMNGDGEK